MPIIAFMNDSLAGTHAAQDNKFIQTKKCLSFILQKSTYLARFILACLPSQIFIYQCISVSSRSHSSLSLLREKKKRKIWTAFLNEYGDDDRKNMHAEWVCKYAISWRWLLGIMRYADRLNISLLFVVTFCYVHTLKSKMSVVECGPTQYIISMNVSMNVNEIALVTAKKKFSCYLFTSRKTRQWFKFSRFVFRVHEKNKFFQTVSH